MTKAIRSLLVGWLFSVGLASATFAEDPLATGTVTAISPPWTLGAALDRVLNHHPDAVAARAEVVAGAGEVRQAGLFANPTLSLELENVAGRDALQGFDGAETTLRLEQPLDLGGERATRRASAAAAQRIAVGQQTLTRADLYLRTVTSFVTLLAAQERLQLAETRLQAAARAEEGVAAQIAAGKAPAVAALRSRPLLVEARLEHQRAVGELAAARADLAALLDSDRPTELVARGDLSDLPQRLASGEVGASPQLALAAAERERAERELAAERARTIPVPTVGFGARRFAATGETALVAGIELPFPIFDRNQGNVAAAHARVEAARQREVARQRQWAAERERAARELEHARAEALALRDESLPALRQAFEGVREGYAGGKFGLLDLLDAQRQFNDAQVRLLAAQVACHVAAARYDTLLGRFPVAGSEIPSTL